jgi:hypothetical protein
MTRALSNAVLPMAAGLALMATSLAGAAQPAGEIPAAFRGAGCNLKYTYARQPKGDASSCVSAKAGRKEGDGHDNDNFIRISRTGVAGVEWDCKVKTVKTASEAEFTFAGDCSDENTQSASTVTLLLRPGRLVIVDQVTEGRHIIDIYRLRDDLE